jgi:hypothetical protein
LDKNLAEIYAVLQKLTGLHRQLLDTVRIERDALVSADLKAIQEVTNAKTVLVEHVRQHESLRLRLIGALAAEWKIPAAEMTLQRMIIQVQGTDQKSAEQFRSALNALTLLIREQNEDNRVLVETSLDHVNTMKRNVLGEAQPRSNTYNKTGQSQAPASDARLISQEA